MVTIAIRENGSEIMSLLHKMLLHKGFSLSSENDSTESDYVLLTDSLRQTISQTSKQFMNKL